MRPTFLSATLIDSSSSPAHQRTSAHLWFVPNISTNSIPISQPSYLLPLTAHSLLQGKTKPIVVEPNLFARQKTAYTVLVLEEAGASFLFLLLLLLHSSPPFPLFPSLPWPSPPCVQLPLLVLTPLPPLPPSDAATTTSSYPDLYSLGVISIYNIPRKSADTILKPACTIQVADNLKILAASFIDGSSISIVYGNALKPSFETVKYLNAQGNMETSITVQPSDTSKSLIPAVMNKSASNTAAVVTPAGKVAILSPADLKIPSIRDETTRNAPVPVRVSPYRRGPRCPMRSAQLNLSAQLSSDHLNSGRVVNVSSGHLSSSFWVAQI